MDLRTVRRYISHRLKVAGAESEIFHLSARDLVHEQTGGVPRLVNQLCDLALVYAFTKGNVTVTRLTVEQVLNDGAFFVQTLDDDTSSLPTVPEVAQLEAVKTVEVVKSVEPKPDKPVLVLGQNQRTKAD